VRQYAHLFLERFIKSILILNTQIKEYIVQETEYHKRFWW